MDILLRAVRKVLGEFDDEAGVTAGLSAALVDLRGVVFELEGE